MKSNLDRFFRKNDFDESDDSEEELRGSIRHRQQNSTKVEVSSRFTASTAPVQHQGVHPRSDLSIMYFVSKCIRALKYYFSSTLKQITKGSVFSFKKNMYKHHRVYS